MAMNRALYVLFYILYLITLAIAIWFLVYYGQVPNWVYIFFLVAIIIMVIGVLIKEFLLQRTRTKSGKDVSKNISGWLIAYVAFHILAFLLFITGVVFVGIYGTIAWWILALLAIGIILTVVASMIYAFYPRKELVAYIVYLVGVLIYIAGFILLVYFSDAPWWIWLILLTAVGFSVVASVFEYISEKNEVIVPDLPPKKSPYCKPTTTTTYNINDDIEDEDIEIDNDTDNDDDFVFITDDDIKKYEAKAPNMIKSPSYNTNQNEILKQELKSAQPKNIGLKDIKIPDLDLDLDADLPE
jgi:hypothetical protein